MQQPGGGGQDSGGKVLSVDQDLVDSVTAKEGWGSGHSALVKAHLDNLDREEGWRRLETWGPEQVYFVTNSFVLNLLLAYNPWVHRPFTAFLTRVLGIHESWLRSKDFQNKYKMYLHHSLYRKWIGSQPDQEWHYLQRLRPGGDLYCAIERLPMPTPHPLGRLARHLTSLAEVDSRCGYCSRSGKLPLCGCYTVSYCDKECQLRDAGHIKLCEQAGQEAWGEAVLPLATRSALSRQRKANKKKSLMIRRLQAGERRRYHGGLVRGGSGGAWQKTGRQLVTASIAPGDQLLKMVRHCRHGKLDLMDVLSLKPPLPAQVRGLC